MLVQTRGGRWIFPKGGVEPGLTAAQSAALEAFEEAGVHGRMEAIPFGRYFRRGDETATAAAQSAPRQFAVTVHLCEVSRLEPPQESNRNPTWFSTKKAKQRLLKDRAQKFGAELAHVVDRAVARVRRLHESSKNLYGRRQRDGLQEVRLEALADGRAKVDLREAALICDFFRQRGDARSAAAIESAVRAHLRKVHQIGRLVGKNVAAKSEIPPPLLRLGAGPDSTTGTTHNITAIDSVRRASFSKPGNLPLSKRKAPSRPTGGRTEKG
jgi:ADP-ribose pyrophosphatase YjhB (NUDIX family)